MSLTSLQQVGNFPFYQKAMGKQVQWILGIGLQMQLT